MLILTFIILLMLWVPVSAQEPVGITKISLDVDSLMMEVGESYSFQISLEPENVQIPALKWYSSDDSILQIDPVHAVVTAAAPGKAGILVESFDKNAYAVCSVTVNGSVSSEEKEMKSGSSLLLLSDPDRNKITSLSINRYLDFIGEWIFSAKAYSNASQRIFNVAADVKPGTEAAEAERAKALGMVDAVPLKNLNAVTLVGTLEQILSFTGENDDLLEVFELSPKFIIDPVEEDFSGESVRKSINLEGNTERLSSISTAHDLGYDGTGAVIAVIDTGLNSCHEQFAGRVIAEKCFSTGDYSDEEGTYSSVCAGNAPEADSAAPSGAVNPSAFTHGSHVAGIMAGRDGIAPGAQIVAIQGFSEISYPCISDEEKTCRSIGMLTADELKAYDYLLELVNSGIKITAVNMSYGTSSVWPYSCEKVLGDPEKRSDYLRDIYPYMQLLNDAGILPVSSSGNDYRDRSIGEPACLSNVVSVGALADLSTPLLAPYSNHADYLDITAPGTDIYSALYPGGYGTKSGTSMAAPMVTGALAIMRQIFPENSSSDLIIFLQHITPGTVSKRSSDWSYDRGTGITFSYTKPVLNFSELASHVPTKLSVDPANVRGYDRKIIISFARDLRADGYDVKVYDVPAGKAVSPAIDTVNSGNLTYIIISGSELVNGKTYRLTLAPWLSLGRIHYTGNRVTVNSVPDASTQLPNGWIRENNKVYYHRNGIKLAGCHEIGSIWYRFDKDGVLHPDWQYQRSEKKLVFPAGLTSVRESAFEGITSFGEVILPDGLKTIGNSAFANCSGLVYVFVPDSVVQIGRNAFSGNPNLVLACESDNYAAAYARENDIPYMVSGQ